MLSTIIECKTNNTKRKSIVESYLSVVFCSVDTAVESDLYKMYAGRV